MSSTVPTPVHGGINAAGNYSKIAVAAGPTGELVIVALKVDPSSVHSLTIWLPAPGGQWLPIQPAFKGLSTADVVDFDMVSNHITGRGDDTIDLVFTAFDPKGGLRTFYLPAVPFSTDPGRWAQAFTKVIEVTEYVPEFPSRVLMGLASASPRSIFAIDGGPSGKTCRVDFDPVTGFPTARPIAVPGDPNDLEFGRCLATRWPSYLHPWEDALVILAPQSNPPLVQLALPDNGQRPNGEAWSFNVQPPLVGAGVTAWKPMTTARSFLMVPGVQAEMIMVNSAHANVSDVQGAWNWVLSSKTLFKDDGHFALAKPAGAGRPWGDVRAWQLPAQGGQAPTWHWIQILLDGQTPTLAEARSVQALDPTAICGWLQAGSVFDGAVVTAPGASAVLKLAIGSATGLSVATSGGAGDWTYQPIPNS